MQFWADANGPTRRVASRSTKVNAECVIHCQLLTTFETVYMPWRKISEILRLEQSSRGNYLYFEDRYRPIDWLWLTYVRVYKL